MKEKLDIINQDIVPNIKELVIENFAQIKCMETRELIDKID